MKRDEPKQERVKEDKKKEEKKKEEKKKEKSKSEARKERTRDKKAGGGGGGAKPLSMQQLITQNLPASRERMVRSSDVSVFLISNHLTLLLPRLKGRRSQVSTQALPLLSQDSILRLTQSWT